MKHSPTRLELLKMAQRTLEENHRAQVEVAKTAVEAAVSKDPSSINLWEGYVPKGYGISEMISLASHLESFVKVQEPVSVWSKLQAKIKMLLKSIRLKLYKE